MTFEEYTVSRPVEGNCDGVPSPWLDVCPIDLPSGKLLVSDPAYFPDDPLVVMLDPGRYRVQVRLIDYECDRRVARMRVMGEDHAVLGALLGEVPVDFAQLGVADQEAMLRLREFTPEEMEQFWEAVDPYALCGILPWDREHGIEMPYVSTGFGDGRYTVYELRGGDRRVGAEIAFIEDAEWD